MIMTRWHIDDPAARFIERFPNTKVLSYPAIAIKDEPYRKEGEALFPEHKPKDFLLVRKSLMTAAGWESVYQQSPIVGGGEVFPVEMFEMTANINRKDIRRSVRYWDKAGTEDGGAYSSGCLMHLLKDGTFLIEDIVRGQWKAIDREKHIKQTAKDDAAKCPNLEIWVEQEPGSGGKESAEATIRMLAGYKVFKDPVSGQGSKEVRAEPYAAQVQGGNVALRAGASWVRDFMDEHETWPGSKYKDQVDSAAGAFNKLALGDGYDTSLAWV
jgi:predicted phage terminase large subunit-like protein